MCMFTRRKNPATFSDYVTVAEQESDPGENCASKHRLDIHREGSHQLQGAKEEVHQLGSTWVLYVLLQFGLQGGQ